MSIVQMSMSSIYSFLLCTSLVFGFLASTRQMASAQQRSEEVPSQGRSEGDSAEGSGGDEVTGGRLVLGDAPTMSPFEFQLSLVILGFGVLVLIAEVLLLRRVRCNAEELLRIFGITLIVIGALIVVPAGFSAQAIAPAMGLLGTIAGYLLSQRTRSPADQTKRNESDLKRNESDRP